MEIWEMLIQSLKERIKHDKDLGNVFIQPEKLNVPWGIQGCLYTRPCGNGYVEIVVPMLEKKLLRKPSISFEDIGMTLSLVLCYLHSVGIKNTENISCNMPQLFALETCAMSGIPHGASLDVSMSGVAVTFLQKYSKKDFLNIYKKMKIYWSMMYPDDKKNCSVKDFSVFTTEYGSLTLTTIGDATDLAFYEPENIEKGEGIHLQSHNVDSFHQQFNLIVGISMIWDLVYKEIKKEQTR